MGSGVDWVTQIVHGDATLGAGGLLTLTAGVVRLLDLGIHTVGEIATGPITLYTPQAGEIVGPLIERDVTPSNTQGYMVACAALPVGLSSNDANDARDSIGQASQTQGLPVPGLVISSLMPTCTTALFFGLTNAIGGLGLGIASLLVRPGGGPHRGRAPLGGGRGGGHLGRVGARLRRQHWGERGG